MPHSIDAIRAVSYFSTSLFDKHSVEEVLWDLTKNVIRELRYEDCVIYLIDPSRPVLVQHAAYGSKNPDGRTIYNRIEIPVGQGIVGTCAATGKPQLVPDTRLDPRYIVDDQPRLSELAVPILLGDTVYGVIDSEHSEAGFFSEEDLHLLTIAASICAQKIRDLKSRVTVRFDAENEYYVRFCELMDRDRRYRDPDMSLEAAARLIGISAGYLSKLINQVTGRNFAAVLNEYRVEEVKRRLADPKYRHYSLLSIGLEAGFNSKASFLRNFKHATGKTPAEFLAFIEN